MNPFPTTEERAKLLAEHRAKAAAVPQIEPIQLPPREAKLPEPRPPIPGLPSAS